MKQKHYIISITALLSTLIGSLASALTYQNNIDISFTFNPVVSIAVSDDLRIDNLSPGQYGDSNEITITSGTNNLAGYTLYATVGDNTHSNPSYSNTNLNHPDGASAFTSINNNKTSLSSFDESSNTWGYSYCIGTNDCTSNNYWISGDYDDSSLGYNGLPLYTTNTGVKLVDTANNASVSTIKFKIGARATSTQIAGTYSNVINFTAITKILTTNYTITYNDTTTEATGMPSSQSDTITVNTNVTLSSTEPTRDGYNFAGWCTVNNSSDPTTCSGTTYQAGSTYAISNTGGNVTVPLYAVWEQAGYNLTYDLTFPSVVNILIEDVSSYSYTTLADLGTDTHFTGIIKVPTTTTNLRVKWLPGRETGGGTCSSTGDVSIYYCPTYAYFYWDFGITGDGSITLNITGWD